MEERSGGKEWREEVVGGRGRNACRSSNLLNSKQVGCYNTHFQQVSSHNYMTITHNKKFLIGSVDKLTNFFVRKWKKYLSYIILNVTKRQYLGFSQLIIQFLLFSTFI